MHSGPDHDKRITQIFGFFGKKEGFPVPGTSIQAILLRRKKNSSTIIKIKRRVDAVTQLDPSIIANQFNMGNQRTVTLCYPLSN
jgi:uridylate kinase